MKLEYDRSTSLITILTLILYPLMDSKQYSKLVYIHFFMTLFKHNRINEGKGTFSYEIFVRKCPFLLLPSSWSNLFALFLLRCHGSCSASRSRISRPRNPRHRLLCLQVFLHFVRLPYDIVEDI